MSSQPLKQCSALYNIFKQLRSCWCLRFHSGNWSTLQTAEQCRSIVASDLSRRNIDQRREVEEGNNRVQEETAKAKRFAIWWIIISHGLHQSCPIWHEDIAHLSRRHFSKRHQDKYQKKRSRKRIGIHELTRTYSFTDVSFLSGDILQLEVLRSLKCKLHFFITQKKVSYTFFVSGSQVWTERGQGETMGHANAALCCKRLHLY